MTIQDEVIQHVISENRAKKFNKDKIQNEMDDAMEALTIIDSAIQSTYLKDKHSLILQQWAKEYQQDIDNCKNQLKEDK